MVAEWSVRSSFSAGCGERATRYQMGSRCGFGCGDLAGQPARAPGLGVWAFIGGDGAVVLGRRRLLASTTGAITAGPPARRAGTGPLGRRPGQGRQRLAPRRRAWPAV